MERATYKVKSFIETLEELDKSFNEKFEEHLRKLNQQRDSFFLTTQSIRNDVLCSLETCKKFFIGETDEQKGSVNGITGRLRGLIDSINQYKDSLPAILDGQRLEQLNLPSKQLKLKPRVKSVNFKSEKLLAHFSSKMSLKSRKKLETAKPNAFSFATKFPTGNNRRSDNILERHIKRQSCFEKISDLKKGIENDYEEYLRHKQPRKTTDFLI